MIVLVDDLKNFKVLHSKLSLLAETDFDIQSISNGLEALDVINKYLKGSASVTDVTFIDLNMSVADALEFIPVFKGIDFYRKSKVKIVIRIEALDQKNKDRAVRLGAEYIVSSPLTDEYVRSLL